jgi:hypothetical protein
MQQWTVVALCLYGRRLRIAVRQLIIQLVVSHLARPAVADLFLGVFCYGEQ